MKTNLIFLKEVGTLLLFIVITAFSCNNEETKETEQTEGNFDTLKEKVELTIDSAQLLFETQRQTFSEWVNLETERIDARIDELKEIQAKSKEKINAKIKEELDEQEAERKRLKDVWKKMEQATKNNWRNYEKEMKEIMKGNKEKKGAEKR